MLKFSRFSNDAQDTKIFFLKKNFREKINENQLFKK